MGKELLIRYIRDDNKRPYGVVVGLPNGNVGLSLCNKVDKWNKDYGKELAIGRAYLSKQLIIGEYRKDIDVIDYAVNKVLLALDKLVVGLDDVVII